MHPSRPDPTPYDERRFVTALARGLDLLRGFRPGEILLRNRDFVERTGLPKATVNRLAYTLTVLGYLRFDEALGKYALDAGVLSLGHALLAGTGALTLGLAPGSRLSMLTSSMGRAYLAVQPAEQREALFAELRRGVTPVRAAGARVAAAEHAWPPPSARWPIMRARAAAIRFATGTTTSTQWPCPIANRASGAC